MGNGADPPREESGARRNLGGVLVLVALLILVAGSVLHTLAGYSGGGDTSIHAYGTDDAFISYRYAANLVEGHGLVFNPGDRVEGYTNLLYVLLMAAVMSVTDPANIYVYSSWLNLAFVLLAFWLFVRAAERHLGKRVTGVAAMLMALCPLMWLWTASGMETTMVLALQLTLWVTVEAVERSGSRRNLLLLGAAMGLVVLARADGFLVPLFVVVYFLVRARPRLALYSLALAAPMILALFAWRLSYYGEPLPNTYYVRDAGSLLQRFSLGAWLLSLAALRDGLLLHIVAICGLAGRGVWQAVRRKRPPFENLRFGPAFCLFIMVYSVYIDGDHFLDRFLLLLFPIGILSILGLLKTVRRRAWAWAVVALVAVWQLAPLYHDVRFHYTRAKYDSWIELGRFLDERYPKDTLLATAAAGKIPYFSGLRTIDMLGHTDKHIAHLDSAAFTDPGHDKTDTAYVLAQEPHLIAHWMVVRQDMLPDLPRERYEREGYRLRYLLNTTRQRFLPNIVDVARYDEDQIGQLLDRGFLYAVLERQ